MTDRPRFPAILTGLDPLAAETVRGIPYADQSAALADDQDDPWIPFRHVDGTIVAQLGEGFGELRAALTALSIDRGDVASVGRPVPAGDEKIVVVSGTERTSRSLIPDVRASLAGEDADVEVVQRVSRRDSETIVAATLAYVDVMSFAHPALAARALLQEAASGAACVVEPGHAEALAEHLHAELVATACEPAALTDGPLSLASRRARLRTTAWAYHQLSLRWDPDGWQVGMRSRRTESVSVILATMRPAMVEPALARVAAQRGVDVQVVLVTHGFSDEEASRARGALARCGLDGTHLAAPSRVPLGGILNAASECADAGLIAKWDDDDLYGPRHLLDLVAARRATGAALVGKYAEFIHFERSNETVWRLPKGAETWSPAVAGGTLMIDRGAWDEVGGFPPVRRAVDHHLRQRVHEQGLGCYRTHGFGYALVRHDQGHTWTAPDDQLRRGAFQTFVGLPDALQLADGSA